MRKPRRALPAAVMVLLALGCVSGQQPAGTPPVERDSPGFALPRLPLPGQIDARAASDGTTTLQGSEYDTASLPPQRASVSGTDDALFEPQWTDGFHSTAGDYAYALYIFPWDGNLAWGEAACIWTGAAPTGRCWIGLGNFDKQRWDWFPAVQGVRAVTQDVAPYVSSQNTILVLVLLLGTTPATLDCISFSVFFPALLTVLNPPDDGSGAPTDPFIQNVYDTVYFSLVSVPDGDEVSGDARTKWFVSPAAAGTVIPMATRASLHVTSGFTGPFSVGATFDGLGSDPERIFFSAIEGTQGPNLAPVALLYATPANGLPPLRVDFDARDCYDDDGTIVDFRWDFNGDGSIDLQGDYRTTQYQYAATGAYNATLEIEDDRGATDTAIVLITVENPAATWHVALARDSVDSVRNSVGKYSAVWDAGSFPALAFSERDLAADVSRLRFMRAADANGTAWGSALILDTAVDGKDTTGFDVRLRNVSGFPAVAFAFYDWSAGVGSYWLFYKRADDALGAAWSTPAVVADSTPGSSRGTHCQLLDLGAAPGLSYFDTTVQQLLWVSATDAQGTSWSAPQVLEAPQGLPGSYSCGEYNSLAMIGGRPAVSYLTRISSVVVGDKLQYVRANDAMGTSWSAPVTVRQAQGIAQGTSLTELPGGLPGILYANTNNIDQNMLTFTSGSAPEGGTWSLGRDVITTGYYNWLLEPQLLLYVGKPAMGCLLQEGMITTTSSVQFALAMAADGSAWQSPLNVGDAGNSTEMSMGFVAGRPAVSYYNEDEDALYFGMYY